MEFKELIERVSLPPLDATKETYIIQCNEVFEVILQILRSIDVTLFQSQYMQLDQHQQYQLHPVMQSYLMVVHTVGDGNCLSRSLWKQLFPERHETADSARFMRQITLYTIYKNESFYRGIVSALGYNYNLNDYVPNIMQMGSYCFYLSLSSLSEGCNIMAL